MDDTEEASAEEKGWKGTEHNGDGRSREESSGQRLVMEKHVQRRRPWKELHPQRRSEKKHRICKYRW